MKALLKCARPLEWRGYLGLYLAGAVQGGLYAAIKAETLVGLIAVFTPYMAATYIANNVADVDCDVNNPRKIRRNPVASGELSRRTAVSAVAVLSVLGGLSSLLFLPRVLPVYLAALFLSMSYSLPPRFKCRPFLDLASHSLFFGALIVVMGALSASVNLDIYTVALSAVYSAFLELRNELEDFEYDKGAGCLTTVCAFGPEKGRLAMHVTALLSVFLAALRIAELWFAILSLPVLLVYSKEADRSVRAVDLYVALSFLIPALGGLV